MKIKMKMKEINQLKKKNDFINKKINNIFISLNKNYIYIKYIYKITFLLLGFLNSESILSIERLFALFSLYFILLFLISSITGT